MKKPELIFAAVGLGGLAVAGYVFFKRQAGEGAAVSDGSSASDYTSGAFSNWASSQKAISNFVAEPVGIFKTAVDSVMSLVTEPRGIRNNNPLNIVWSSVNPWNGQTGSDGRFSIFDKPENGIRACAKILDRYAKRGIITIQKIIETWAPASENNVQAYVNHVSQLMGRSANSVIVKMSGDYVPLIAAMIKHENGKQPYSLETIKAGIALS
jgi:hypothetical protein